MRPDGPFRSPCVARRVDRWPGWRCGRLLSGHRLTPMRGAEREVRPGCFPGPNTGFEGDRGTDRPGVRCRTTAVLQDLTEQSAPSRQSRSNSATRPSTECPTLSFRGRSRPTTACLSGIGRRRPAPHAVTERSRPRPLRRATDELPPPRPPRWPGEELHHRQRATAIQSGGESNAGKVRVTPSTSAQLQERRVGRIEGTYPGGEQPALGTADPPPSRRYRMATSPSGQARPAHPSETETLTDDWSSARDPGRTKTLGLGRPLAKSRSAADSQVGTEVP